MTKNTQNLVRAFRKKRETEGLSIRAVSAIIGVSFSSLARIERGEGEPDNNSTIRILNWLGENAQEFGLSYQEAALAHFRAAKNVSSKTIHCLLQAANALKQNYDTTANDGSKSEFKTDSSNQAELEPVSHSKSEMEEMATELRKEVGLSEDAPLDALNIGIEGVEVFVPNQLADLSKQCLSHLTGVASGEWSAMSVPLDMYYSRWAIFRNDLHGIERQRVTYLEECWHILLGHKLTRIAKFADAYGRTYDSTEEHDAYYLAAASLLPEAAIKEAVKRKISSAEVASRFGASTELVEYRIKRLGQWRQYKGISITLGNSSQQ